MRRNKPKWKTIKALLLAGTAVSDIEMLTATDKSLIYRFAKKEKIPLVKNVLAPPYEDIYDRVLEGEYRSFSQAADDFGISRQLLAYHVRRIKNARNKHST